VVGRDGQVGRQKRLAAVLLQPLLTRREHDVVLVAEIVGFVVALLVHVLRRVEVLVPEVLHEVGAPLELLGRRLEKGRPVAVISEELRQAARRDRVRLGLGPLGVKGRGHPA
jgi:hypothetical protein